MATTLKIVMEIYRKIHDISILHKAFYEKLQKHNEDTLNTKRYSVRQEIQGEVILPGHESHQAAAAPSMRVRGQSPAHSTSRSWSRERYTASSVSRSSCLCLGFKPFNPLRFSVGLFQVGRGET